jgi:tRNA modification GTPase
VVLDLSEPLTPADAAVLARHPDALRVANKADRPAAWDPHPLGALPISAQTGAGIERLVSALAHTLVPEPPGPGVGVPFRVPHVLRLDRARRLLAGGRVESALRALDRLLSGRIDSRVRNPPPMPSGRSDLGRVGDDV